MIEFHAEVLVRKAGYRWQGTRKDPISRLVYADEVVAEQPASSGAPAGELHTSEGGLFRIYNPFDKEPALFRIFAELGTPGSFFAGISQAAKRDETQTAQFEQELRAFANRYGIPTVENRLWNMLGQSSVQAIRHAVHEMRLAVTLWDAIKTRDRTTIASLAHWDAELGWQVEYEGYKISPVGRVTREFMRASCPDLVVPGRRRDKDDEFALGMEILEFLIAERVDARIEFFQPRRGVLALRMHVKTLMSSMWVQLAMAIVENKEYRRCELCGKPFELSQLHGRRHSRDDKQFCTTNCRVKSYQRRQTLARKMQSDGVKLRDIAKAVESDMKTVKGWLKEE